jgi:peroxiredoxin
MKRLCMLALMLGCSSAMPTWEQPGLGGAVRPEMGGPQPASLAPDFELPADAGGAFRLSSLRGSWVVLHFTASWCPYCDSEIAHLGELADRYAPRGVKVVLVDEKEPEARWHAYATAHVSPSVVSVRDEEGVAALRYAPPRAQPSFEDRSQVALDATLIVDPEGVIRLFLLPDSAHFDPTFTAVRRELDRMLAAEIVHVAVSVGPGDGTLDVALDVAPGYHVQSHTPSEEQYVPTRVDVHAAGVEFGEPRYPAGATYDATSHVAVPHKAAGAGPRRVTATVSYQACTASRCLFPTHRRIETNLTFGDAP